MSKPWITAHIRPVFRKGFQLLSIILLLLIAWKALYGGIEQYSVAHSIGQQIETVIQLFCGVLSVLVVVTFFFLKQWARIIQISWSASLTLTVGLSALVWGPPMPLISLLLSFVALLLSYAIIRALQMKAPAH